MLIVSACDLRYEPIVRPLVRSVLINTGYRIRVDYLNLKGLRQESAADMAANYRVGMIAGILEQGFDEPVLWLDADTIVRTAISFPPLCNLHFDSRKITLEIRPSEWRLCQLFLHGQVGDIGQLEKWLCTEYDTLAVHTPEFDVECNQWLISTVGVAATANGRQFMAYWKAKLEVVAKENGPSIMNCQTAYVRALRDCAQWIRAKDIGYEYSDKYFRDHTPIWEAQGERKHEDPKWLAEVKKYTEQ